MIPFPKKKYNIIYADPPWSYQNGNVSQGGVNAQYKTMKLTDIKNLPVNEISDDPCVLLMWATFPLLKEAFEVISAWGFDYKTLGFSWLKTNKDGSPFFGIGYYAKSNQEVCLLSTKGKGHSLVKSNKVSSVLITEKTRHSEKPSLARIKIIELFGDVPKIELFARTKTEGWDVWGNEV
jgi:N6-adenosine-specific RNA methylase IME4